ncbi:MAG: hypothetical protein EXR08_10785 [Alphaproteobacteria bacterium]|nr:hypothetical protein [Alphaproteobacteria bacterium]
MLFVFVACADKAAAACNSTTVYATILDRYLYQDSGFSGYDDPVFQGGATLNCDGGWWFDLFNSSALSRDGTYGSIADRQLADEFDFTVAQNSEFKTGIGTFQYQIFSSYYVMADFDRAKDDIIELRLELARAFKLPGSLNIISVTPFVRAMEFVGLGVYRNQTIIRSGIRTSIGLTDRLSLNSALAVSSDPRTGIDIFRTETGPSFALNKQVSVFGEWQTSEGTKSAAMVGFSRTF